MNKQIWHSFSLFKAPVHYPACAYMSSGCVIDVGVHVWDQKKFE